MNTTSAEEDPEHTQKITPTIIEIGTNRRERLTNRLAALIFEVEKSTQKMIGGMLPPPINNLEKNDRPSESTTAVIEEYRDAFFAGVPVIGYTELNQLENPMITAAIVNDYNTLFHETIALFGEDNAAPLEPQETILFSIPKDTAPKKKATLSEEEAFLIQLKQIGLPLYVKTLQNDWRGNRLKIEWTMIDRTVDVQYFYNARTTPIHELYIKTLEGGRKLSIPEIQEIQEKLIQYDTGFFRRLFIQLRTEPTKGVHTETPATPIDTLRKCA